MPDRPVLGPCVWGTPTGKCGVPGRRYQQGFLCTPHTPWARAGTPEPLTPTEVQQRKEGAPDA